MIVNLKSLAEQFIQARKTKQVFKAEISTEICDKISKDLKEKSILLGIPLEELVLLKKQTDEKESYLLSIKYNTEEYINLSSEDKLLFAKIHASKTIRNKTKSKGVGAFITGLITNGLSNDEILIKVKNEFPDGNTNLNCIRWYRNKLNKTK